MSNDENTIEETAEELPENNALPQVMPVMPEPLSQEEFDTYAESLYAEVISAEEWGEAQRKSKINPQDDETVKAFRKAYIQERIIDDSLYSLNRILEGDCYGFNFFQTLCNFQDEHMQFLHESEGTSLPTRLPVYISQRLEQVAYLGDLSRIAQNTYEAYGLLNDSEHKMTFYEAGNMVEKLENDIDILPDNTRAKIYFLLAKGYQKANSSPYEHKKASREEIDYLNKTLDFASDYKLIFAAQKRLGTDSIDEKITVGAYKRALKNTADRKALYRINNEIARLYTEFAQTAGFIYENSPKQKYLSKAEEYLYQAFKYAEKENKLPVLKNIAAVQSSLGKTDKWIATKTEIAMKHLKGSERCKALIKIASRLPQQQAIPFYERAINEAKKSKISLREKTEIIQNSCRNLENLYKNPGKIQKLKEAAKKYLQQDKSKSQTPLNILDKYKLKKGKDL